MRIDDRGRMENCLVFSNATTTPNHSSATGGGIHMDGGSVVNCTIAYNSSPTNGGGIYRAGGAVTNCIIYLNTKNGAPNDYYGATSAVWYSCAPELIGGAQSNITADPLFKNGASGDFRLSASSPCRNTGWLYDGAAADLDLDRGPRVRQGTIEMGAYELLPPAGTLLIVR